MLLNYGLPVPTERISETTGVQTILGGTVVCRVDPPRTARAGTDWAAPFRPVSCRPGWRPAARGGETPRAIGVPWRRRATGSPA